MSNDNKERKINKKLLYFGLGIAVLVCLGVVASLPIIPITEVKYQTETKIKDIAPHSVIPATMGGKSLYVISGAFEGYNCAIASDGEQYENIVVICKNAPSDWLERTASEFHFKFRSSEKEGEYGVIIYDCCRRYEPKCYQTDICEEWKEVCTQTFLGFCTKKEWVCVKYKEECKNECIDEATFYCYVTSRGPYSIMVCSVHRDVARGTINSIIDDLYETIQRQTTVQKRVSLIQLLFQR